MGPPSLVPSRSRVKEEGENKNRVGPKYPALFVGTDLRYLDLLSCMKSYSTFRLSPITVALFLVFSVKVLALTSLIFFEFFERLFGFTNFGGPIDPHLPEIPEDDCSDLYCRAT